jgi:hypothetical protein
VWLVIKQLNTCFTFSAEEDKEKSLGFAEKLAMHIVKNIQVELIIISIASPEITARTFQYFTVIICDFLQVFVSNIHIRYEDTVCDYFVQLHHIILLHDCFC